MSLAKADLNGFCKEIDGFGEHIGKNRINNFLPNALKDTVESRVAIETLTVSLEGLKVCRSSFAGLCAANLCRIHKLFALEFLIQILVAVRGQHMGNASGLKTVDGQHRFLARKSVLIEEDTALGDDIRTLGFSSGSIHAENISRNAVKVDSRH